MKISQEDVILIKNIYLPKQYGARRLLNELPDKGWKVGSIDSLLNRSHAAVLSNNQAAVDRVRRIAVEDLVLSHEESQKGIGQLVRFRMKLPFSVQVYTEK